MMRCREGYLEYSSRFLMMFPNVVCYSYPSITADSQLTMTRPSSAPFSSLNLFNSPST